MKPICILKTDITKQQKPFSLCINPTIHVKMTDRQLRVNAVNMKMFDRKYMWKVNATVHCKTVLVLSFTSITLQFASLDVLTTKMVEDSLVLGYDTASLGNQFAMF